MRGFALLFKDVLPKFNCEAYFHRIGVFIFIIFACRINLFVTTFLFTTCTAKERPGIVAVRLKNSNL